MTDDNISIAAMLAESQATLAACEHLVTRKQVAAWLLACAKRAQDAFNDPDNHTKQSAIQWDAVAKCCRDLSARVAEIGAKDNG